MNLQKESTCIPETSIYELEETARVLTSTDGGDYKYSPILHKVEAPIVNTPRAISRETILKLRDALFASNPSEYIYTTIDVIAPAPRSLTVECNGRCNLACVQCPRHGDTTNNLRSRNKQLLPLATFKGYVDSAFPMANYRGVPTFEHAAVVLYIQNEPLLDPEISQRAAYVGRKGLGCVISSNFNVDTDKIEFLLNPDSGVSKLIVSVNSFDTHNYERINSGGTLKKVIDNLKLLRNRPNSLNVFLQMVVMSENEGEVDDFVKTANDMGFTPLIKSFGTHLERSPSHLIPLKSEITRYHDNQEGDAELSPFKRRACARLWRGPTIDAYGNHIMCSTSGHHPSGVMGRPEETDILASWNSFAMQKLRFGLLMEGRQHKDICVGCDAFLPFRGSWKGAGV